MDKKIVLTKQAVKVIEKKLLKHYNASNGYK